LRNLLGGASGRIVGKPMVLPIAIGELGLEKKFVAADAAPGDGLGESIAHGRFEIVLALVGGVERAKAGAQRKRDQLRGAVFLPGSAVNESWGCYDVLLLIVAGLRRPPRRASLREVCILRWLAWGSKHCTAEDGCATQSMPHH
jgi:hypothetical protein